MLGGGDKYGLLFEGGSEMKKETIKRIKALLHQIDGYAADSRGSYENARGNDSACYHDTEQIRKLLNEETPLFSPPV